MREYVQWRRKLLRNGKNVEKFKLMSSASNFVQVVPWWCSGSARSLLIKGL